MNATRAMPAETQISAKTGKKTYRPFLYLNALMVVLIAGWEHPVFGQLPMTGTYVPELQAVDTMLQNFMAGTPIPGGTIAITHDDKVIYERGIGYSDAAQTVPMQETALMRLASVSKPITASAIQQLAKDGQLSLDDKVFNIAGNGGILNITPYSGTLGDSRLQDITVQHLLEHQGGWNRDTAGDLAFRDVVIANALGVPSPPGILNSARYILSQPLQFTPGADYNYSNIGYMFLGMVVEEASGQSYESYVDEMVSGAAGIPAWEVDAGRTFAADQNPREPFYSTQITSSQNVYDPTGPRVPAPYGGWDHEKFLAFGGLIASSKAIALFAQNRIAGGPEIGKLWSDYSMHLEDDLGHVGSLEGTDTVVVQASLKDWTYSILFDRRPADGYSYVVSLYDPLKRILDGLSTWPAPLVYAGDFTNDQWLTLDDVTLFNQALALGSEAAFNEAYPTARYSAGDIDGDGLVSGSDAAGLIGALQHAGVPAQYVSQVLGFPGDYDLDGHVDGADLLIWQRHPNIGSLADWQANFGMAPTAPMKVAVPESAAMFLAFFALATILVTRASRRLHARGASQAAACILASAVLASGARADIYQWEYINPVDPDQGKRQSTTLAPDGAGVPALPGVDLAYRNLTYAYLIGADLTNATAYGTNLTNADLTQAKLTNVDFYRATLTGADFRDADIRGASFNRTPPQNCGIFGCGSYGTGINVSQLYSTASYKTGDLSGINFGYHNFIGINFTGQNLTNASFSRTSLNGANFTVADLRGAFFDCVSCISGAVFINNIGNYGNIRGLDLGASELLIIRDYDGNPSDYSGNLTPPIPIIVDQRLAMRYGGTLRMVFEADAWDSTISFAPGIPVTLGGALELTFAADVNPATQLGRSFDLFNWTGVAPVGAFAVSTPYGWDLSNLYTTGEVTLTAVPEPCSLLVFIYVLSILPIMRRT